MSKKAVFCMADSTFSHIEKFDNLTPTFSQDLNLIAMARYLESQGYEIYWCPNWFPEQRVRRVFFSQDSAKMLNYEYSMIRDAELLFTSNIIYVPERKFFPKAKQIAFMPAVFIAEHPESIDPLEIAIYPAILRERTDFVITQNERMKQVLFLIFAVLGGWKNSERILVSPLGIDSLKFNDDFFEEQRNIWRKKIGVGKNAIVFINGGGVWRWTDFNKFLEAFISVAIELPKKSIFLIQPSLGQTSNLSHSDYHQETKKLIRKANRLIPGQVQIYGEWEKASQALPYLLSAADIGINLNQDTFENWMSHRVRILEYLKMGLPILSTNGDLGHLIERPGILYTRVGDFESYRKSIYSLVSNPTKINTLKRQIRKEASLQINGPQYADVLEKILESESALEFGPVSLPEAFLITSNNRPRKSLYIYYKKMYRLVTQNAILHRLLVFTGVRAAFRATRKFYYLAKRKEHQKNSQVIFKNMP
jgi:glycosyltransferase involved in cell wall biosynthesis